MLGMVSTQPLSALVVASAALAALVATAMTLAASSHRMHRGQGWWLIAQWLLVAGLVLLLMPGERVLSAMLGEVLMLQWPILVAIGLRRFNAREPLPGSAAQDGVVLGFATAVALAEAASEAHGAGWHGAMALTYGYAAGLVLRYPPTRARLLLKMLAGMLAAGAALHAGAVVLPAMVPRLFVALRLGVAIALVVAVTVEIAANPHGMGYAMMIAQQSLEPALMLAWLLWIAVLGYAINAGALTLERWVARRMGGQS